MVVSCIFKRIINHVQHPFSTDNKKLSSKQKIAAFVIGSVFAPLLGVGGSSHFLHLLRYVKFGQKDFQAL